MTSCPQRLKRSWADPGGSGRLAPSTATTGVRPAVGIPLGFRLRAISARLWPPTRSRRIRSTRSGGSVGLRRTRSRLALGARWLDSLGEVALELFDRNQPCTPLRLHSRDHRDDAAVERCQAHAERLGGLLARVRERLDTVGELDAGHSTRGRSRRPRKRTRATRAGARRLPPLAARRHGLRRTAIVRLVCTEVHLCLACYRGEELLYASGHRDGLSARCCGRGRGRPRARGS